MKKFLPVFLLFSFSLFSQSLTVDDSFDQGTGLPIGSIIKNVTEFTNNRILLMGHMNMYNGVAVGNISLINSDGSVDYNFNCGSCFNNEIITAVAQGNRLVIGGAFTEVNGVPRKFFARLNEDGSLDSSFDASASFDEFDETFDNMYISQISSVGNYPFQQLYISGGFSVDGMPYVNPIIRLNFDGSLDTTFNFDINFIFPFIESFAVLDNGKILVGTFSDGLFRINSDGSIDESFNVFDTYDCVINSIYVQDNCKILLGGYFFDNDTQITTLLVRLNEDGSVDDFYDSFEVNFDEYTPQVNSISRFNDKILCAGQFTSYNGYDDFFVLNQDGSFDDSFNIGGVTSEFYAENNYISQAVVLNNNKIMIYGRFDKVGGSPVVNLARLGYDDLSVNEYDKSSNLTVYAQNEITYFNSVNNSISSIEFYDISGRLIDSTIVNSYSYSYQLQNNSILLYRLTMNDGKIYTGKMIN